MPRTVPPRMTLAPACGEDRTSSSAGTAGLRTSVTATTVQPPGAAAARARPLPSPAHAIRWTVPRAALLREPGGDQGVPRAARRRGEGGPARRPQDVLLADPGARRAAGGRVRPARLDGRARLRPRQAARLPARAGGGDGRVPAAGVRE